MRGVLRYGILSRSSARAILAPRCLHRRVSGTVRGCKPCVLRLCTPSRGWRRDETAGPYFVCVSTVGRRSSGLNIYFSRTILTRATCYICDLIGTLCSGSITYSRL